MTQIKAEGGGPLDCPSFNVNGFQVFATATEVSILTLSQVVGLSEKGELETGQIPAVVLGIPVAAAKELSILLAAAVKNHESENGVLDTPFLRAQAAK